MEFPVIALTEPQLAALELLAKAHNGGSIDGTVPPGWGMHLRTARSLEQLGLATVTEGTTGGHVKNGRWLKPKPYWSARITDAGLLSLTTG